MAATSQWDAEMIPVPTWIIRGGTSRGVFILESDLPDDRSLWGPYLIDLFGARDARQINGIGGSVPTTSKCCIVGRSERDDADVDYTFAQVGIGQEVVYWDFNCGNLTASVGTYAMLMGLVEPQPGVTTVRVYQTNTRALLTVEVPTSPDGSPMISGDYEMPGVLGGGPAVKTNFSGAVGASLGGALFPTGNRIDTISVPGLGAIECSILDIGNMCVFFRAEDAGLTGLEMLDQGPRLAEIFTSIRRAAQAHLGVDAVKTTPWPVSVTAAKTFTTLKGFELRAEDYDFAVRFAGIQPMGETLHEAYPGTASSCTAVAAVTPGTIVNEVYGAKSHTDDVVTFAHPSGTMALEARTHEEGGEIVVDRAVNTRTVRPIMRGELFARRREIDRIVSVMSADDPTRAAVPAKARALVA